MSRGIGDIHAAVAVSAANDPSSPELYFQKFSGLSIEEFRDAAEAESAGLTSNELAQLLLNTGTRFNYGLPVGSSATRSQAVTFWRSLQLSDLALTHACAVGRDKAWQVFIARYREFLTGAAIGITGSATLGRELADSLYSDLFGLRDRNGERTSPLTYYSGRGSLKGFLRATLAQRHVDYRRRTSRETSLPIQEPKAPAETPAPSADLISRLAGSLKDILRAIEPEERFVLSAWFLDRRTLLEIARILQVHEATISRRISRLTTRLHKDLIASLTSSGMSQAAAEEALGTDPRDMNINLRSVLQSSEVSTFPVQRTDSEAEPL